MTDPLPAPRQDSGSAPRDLTATWGVDAFNNPGAARFRKQLDANTWATSQVLASLETVPEAARDHADFKRALQVLAHSELARAAWLTRITRTPAEYFADWFPPWTADQIRDASQNNDRLWASYIDGLKDTAMAAHVDFTASDGRGFRSSIEDVLIHVFNHSTYHRGQVARLITQCGGQRATTDYISFARLEM